MGNSISNKIFDHLDLDDSTDLDSTNDIDTIIDLDISDNDNNDVDIDKYKKIKTNLDNKSFLDGKFFLDIKSNLQNIVEQLAKCECKCYYCHEPMLILYEHVRENKQWTVDRVDNDI